MPRPCNNQQLDHVTAIVALLLLMESATIKVLGNLNLAHLYLTHYHTQWLNYSKVGGGTLHFFPFLFFPSLSQSSLLLFPSIPPIPLEVGRLLPASGSGQAL